MLEESLLEIDALERNEQFTEVLNDEYLKIKINLRNLLQTSKYCGVCLQNDTHLILLHNDNVSAKYSCNMEREMHKLFCDLIYNELPSSYICSSCNSQLDQIHRFIMKIKYSASIVNSYATQLDTQISKAENTVPSPKDNSEYAVLVLNNQISNNQESLININSQVDKLKPSKKTWLLKNKKMTSDSRKKIENYKSNSLKFTIIKDNNSKTLKFLCYHCKKVFKTRNGINYHLKTINLKRNRKLINALKCTECKTMPCEHEKYLKAVQSQMKTGKQLLRCMDCDYACWNKSNLISHVNKAHLKKFSYLCDTCGKSFHSSAAHYIHKWEFHRDLFVCEYCDKQFKTNDLEAHKNECCNIKRQYKCKECVSTFDTEKELRTHEKKHKSQLYPCDKCSKTFSDVHQHKRHQNYHATQLINRAPSNHECSICTEKFSTLKEIKEHLKSSHRPDEKHICTACDRIFDTREKYHQHKRTVRHKKKLEMTISYNFACDYCSFNCNTRSRLEDHTNMHHLKIKPYNCTVCKKSFTSEKKLRLHSEIHTNVSKFQCQQCLSFFISSLGLKKHISRFHTGEKPHKCDFCSKTFVCRGECNVHMKRKHSECSICCPICHNQFNNLVSLRGHIKNQHWKIKDKNFDVTKIQGVTVEICELFKDGRTVDY